MSVQQQQQQQQQTVKAIHELQVETWLSVLQRLVSPSIEQVIILVKCSAEDFCKKNADTCDLNAAYLHGLNAVMECRDDQLTSKIEHDKEAIRQVLHSFVKCYAAMIAYKTDTECVQAIVIPSVTSWYRKVVRSTFNDLSDPHMVNVRNIKSRHWLRSWIDMLVKRDAESIVPIHAFVKYDEADAAVAPAAPPPARRKKVTFEYGGPEMPNTMPANDPTASSETGDEDEEEGGEEEEEEQVGEETSPSAMVDIKEIKSAIADVKKQQEEKDEPDVVQVEKYSETPHPPVEMPKMAEQTHKEDPPSSTPTINLTP